MTASSSHNENAKEQSCGHNKKSGTITRPTKFVSLNQDDANEWLCYRYFCKFSWDFVDFFLLLFATASESRSGFVFFWDIYQTLHVLKIPLMWLYYVHNKFNLVVCPWVLIFKMFPCKSYNCKKKTFIFIFLQVSYRYVLNCPWSFLHSMNNSFDWKVTELFLVLV